MIISMLGNQQEVYIQARQDKEKAKRLYRVEKTYEEIISKIKSQKH